MYMLRDNHTASPACLYDTEKRNNALPWLGNVTNVAKAILDPFSQALLNHGESELGSPRVAASG